MALSVLSPGGAIHPVVGSIFSAPKPRVALESLGEMQNVRSGDSHEGLHESVFPAPTSTPESRPRRSAPASEDGAPLTITETTQAATASAHPIASGPGRESVSGAPSKATDRDDRHLESAGSADETAAIPAQRTYTPLITAPLVPGPPTLFGPPRRSPNDSSQPLASISRATDDVEIHIGRIEVSAVHPTPLRTTPAKPQRRATSLDEYLKRRDGRPS